MVPMMDDALSNALNGVGSTNGACIDQNGNLSCQVCKITLTSNVIKVEYVKDKYTSAEDDNVIFSIGTVNSTYYLYTGEDYWLGSTIGSVEGNARDFFVDSLGSLYYINVAQTYGVRPSISLKPGFTLIGDGDGTVNNPYIVG